MQQGHALVGPQAGQRRFELQRFVHRFLYEMFDDLLAPRAECAAAEAARKPFDAREADAVHFGRFAVEDRHARVGEDLGDLVLLPRLVVVVAEDGEDWQVPTPVLAPPPEGLVPIPTPISFWAPFDLCPADGPGEDGFALTHPVWVRVRHRLPDDPVLHACALVWLSDIGASPSSRGPGTAAARAPFAGASLDHAVWFHRPARADRWLLQDVQSLVNAGGRGTLRGVIRDIDGRIVASMAQEMLLRPVET